MTIGSDPVHERRVMKAEQKTALLTESLNDASSVQEHGENISLWADTDVRQKFLIVYVMAGNFLTLFCTSVPSPFLARVVMEKGGSLEGSAIVLQATLLTLAMSSIVFGKFQPIFGCRRLFVGGLTVVALCQIGFGFMNHISDSIAFVVAGTILKGVQGIGDGAFVVSSLTLLCQEYPRHIGKVYGFTEAAVGAGYLMGPVFGGPLYDLGGMVLPVVLSGALMLLLAPCGPLLLRRINFESIVKGKFPLSNLFWNVKVLLILGAMGSALGGFALCDSILTAYLKTRHFTATEASFVFFAMGVSYCLGATVSGYIASTGNCVRKTLMTVGYTGCVLFGLILTNNQSEVWIYLAILLFGASVAFCFIPSFNELLHVVGGGTDVSNVNFALHSAVSGAWYFVLGVASFVLALVGSELQNLLQNFSFALAGSICIGYAFTLLFSGAVFVVAKCCRQA